jgi:hypothetical protein
MQAQSIRRRPSRCFMSTVAAVAAIVALAACGGDDDKKATTPSGGDVTTTPASGTGPQSTELGTGVTDTAVKLGIVLIDYDNAVISAHIDFKRGDQQKIFQAFVDDLNKNGGVASGKKIEPVYVVYAPLGTDPPLKACTKLTEDENVFATVGVLYEPTGAAQICFTKQHKSILITHELSEGIVKKAPAGLLLTTDTLAERSTRKLLEEANGKGLLTGKKFGILAEPGTKDRIGEVIEPELKKLGLEVGTAATLQVEGTGDTTAAQSQLDSVIERWKGEGVTALFISGLVPISKVFVQKIKSAMPDVLIVTDGDSSAKGGAQDVANAGVTPNPYAGTLALVGLTDQEQFETPDLRECVKVWETASGTKVDAPKDVKPDANGKRDEIWITVRDACSDLKFFKAIADRIGPYLNNENWINAVNNFGAIPVVATAQASLGKDKYDASDSATLHEWDPTAGTAGDWKAVS